MWRLCVAMLFFFGKQGSSQFSGEESNSPTTSMLGFSSTKLRDFALTLVPPVLVAIWESWIYGWKLDGQGGQMVTRLFLDPWSQHRSWSLEIIRNVNWSLKTRVTDTCVGLFRFTVVHCNTKWGCLKMRWSWKTDALTVWGSFPSVPTASQLFWIRIRAFSSKPLTRQAPSVSLPCLVSWHPMVLNKMWLWKC